MPKISHEEALRREAFHLAQLFQFNAETADMHDTEFYLCRPGVKGLDDAHKLQQLTEALCKGDSLHRHDMGVVEFGEGDFLIPEPVVEIPFASHERWFVWAHAVVCFMKNPLPYLGRLFSFALVCGLILGLLLAVALPTSVLRDLAGAQ